MSAEWYVLDYASRDAAQALAAFRWQFDREPAECEWDAMERCWFVGPVSAAEKRRAEGLVREKAA
jgi:hypothetical protein